MSTIKISDLPNLPSIAANTSNTLFLGVDLPSKITGKFTATTLSQQLFSNNALVVGNNLIVFSNTVGQFSGYDPDFVQVNLQNFNPSGASDMILTVDNGTNNNGFIDLGINNSRWNPVIYGQTSQQPYDGYLIVDGPNNGPQGNLVIGTANPGTNLVFAVGGQYANNIAAVITANGLVLNTQSYLTFSDGTIQTTASPIAYTQAAFAKANTAVQNTANILIPGNVTANNVVANNVIQYNASVNNGTVTQLTSKATAVTINGRTGQITTSNSALNKGVAVQFTVNNSYIVSAKDVVIVNIASGASVGYGISVNSITPGSFVVNIHNSDSTPSGSNASDTLVINFAIIRVA
jgi:hypothetical protein